MLLQLLADYYRSVVENERFYYEYILAKAGSSRESSADQDDQLQLQKQVNKLTVELQSLVHENERLREFQKTQKQALEAKIQGLKNNVDHLKNDSMSRSNGSKRRSASRGGVERKNTDLSRRSDFHLLSPINSKVRTRAGNHMAGGLREVLRSGKQTIFDDSHVMELDDSDKDSSSDGENFGLENSMTTNASATESRRKRRERGSKVEESMEFTSDNTNDIAFLEDLKVRDKKKFLNLPSGELSPDEDSQSSKAEQESGTKRRRLATRRIQTMDSDSSGSD